MEGSWTNGLGSSDLTKESPGSVHSELCGWSVSETSYGVAELLGMIR